MKSAGALTAETSAELMSSLMGSTGPKAVAAPEPELETKAGDS